ncbi:MAG: CRISPR-associated protein Cas4 [Calditrichaceae bacterium]|nr:CRISPR-associated protein Cas4 [Calditrichia bacterium]NUQ42347.1 CRISPR-associated protein Cas4 [Calditrichaceae bacterium]
MFEVVTRWNLVRPDEEMNEAVEDIKLRGYNEDTIITGQFLTYLREKTIRPLSVSNIADVYCPTRRDLYIEKGKNKPQRVRGKTLWSRIAGGLTDQYISSILNDNLHKKNQKKYTTIRKEGLKLYNGIMAGEENAQAVSNLKSKETISYGINAGDTEWLLKLLCMNGIADIANRTLHSVIKGDKSLAPTDIKLNEEINPGILIGISSPATPDFILPEHGIVGDIKTGTEFVPHFQLTCAGYAMAYENANGEPHDINWGIIYLFPTRNRSSYVRPITFAQIYIFPIDDYLRQLFLDIRDEAYALIIEEDQPSFPKPEDRERCYGCKYKEYCIGQGLELKSHEQ